MLDSSGPYPWMGDENSNVDAAGGIITSTASHSAEWKYNKNRKPGGPTPMTGWHHWSNT